MSKIGSVDIVKARRLLCTIGDIALDNNFPKISSGSKGEGLNFKDSDTDLMFIEPDFRVYEFESDVTATDKADLIMNKEETPPCFTYLYLLSNHKVYSQLMFLQKDGKVLLSSELFKKRRLRQLIKTKPTFRHTHGPCITDDFEEHDIAYCIRYFAFNDKMKEYVTKLIGPDNYIKAVKHLMILMLRIDPNTIAILPELRQDIKHPFTIFPCIPVAHFIRFCVVTT
ncbi:unnamed protein product [Mytilus edulis]|uniref:Uncharacterized protein n=1 Tax=Mytilus edulis TaxID=6550 RepID=A0A8S3SQ24_MYTED|nr:unnamed protein product [Mytilus edulis]